MKREDAKREIVAKWRKLPKEQRQTDEQAARFALAIKDEYNFRGGTSDPYQTIKAWLQRDASERRGLPD
jgi:regulator of sirC expression with transglutaminase-like and TPR domain